MRRLQGLGFAVFCLLSGSQWIVADAFPSTLPVLMRESLHLAMASLIAGLVWLVPRRPQVPHYAGWIRLAAVGLLLLGLPALLNEFARVVARESGAALFTLVPLFVVVAVAAYGSGAGVRALMTPALIGVGGALLLLPFQLPPTGGAGLQFAAMFAAVLLTACGSVWLQPLLQGQAIMPVVAVVSGGNAIFLGCAAALRGGWFPLAGAVVSELVRSIALDLPVIFLLIWLIREVAPERLAARFLVVPLVAALEGVVLLHIAIDWRMGLGVLLMVGATGALLFRSEADEGEDAARLPFR